MSLIVILSITVTCCILRTNGGEQTDAGSCFEWMSLRHADLYLYLIKAADINDQERGLFRRKAYEEYFQYWILTRSDHAHCAPDLKFEEYFTRLIKNHVISYVESDDPLSLKPLYQSGVCTNDKMLPQIEGLGEKDLLLWSDYQKLVVKFKETFKF
jgi:hypothetical protein